MEQAQEVLPANCACSLLSCVSCRSASCKAADSCFRRSISFFSWAVSSSCSWETCAVAAANSSATLACITKWSREKGGGKKKGYVSVRRCQNYPRGRADKVLETLSGKCWDPAPHSHLQIEEVIITFLPHYCEFFGCNLSRLTRKLHKATNNLITTSVQLSEFS